MNVSKGWEFPLLFTSCSTVAGNTCELGMDTDTDRAAVPQLALLAGSVSVANSFQDFPAPLGEKLGRQENNSASSYIQYF